MEIYFMLIFIFIIFKSCYFGDFNLLLIIGLGKFIDLSLMYMKISIFCIIEG